jgi:putative oxidoreductase
MDVELLLRVTLGGFAADHGAQGLLGWFRGGGLDGAARFLARHSCPAPRATAAAAAAVQIVAGAGLIAGALTPVMAAALIAVAGNAAAIAGRNGP